MPVIFLIYSYIFINKDIKCYVIFFFTFSLIDSDVFLYLIRINRSVELKSKLLTTTDNIRYPFGVVKRYYSTSSRKTGGLKGITEPKKSSRKILSSPESKPYDDLYEGRGIPKNEPT
jgi:hypothetical protein